MFSLSSILLHHDECVLGVSCLHCNSDDKNGNSNVSNTAMTSPRCDRLVDNRSVPYAYILNSTGNPVFAWSL